MKINTANAINHKPGDVKQQRAYDVCQSAIARANWNVQCSGYLALNLRDLKIVNLDVRRA